MLKKTLVQSSLFIMITLLVVIIIFLGQSENQSRDPLTTKSQAESLLNTEHVSRSIGAEDGPIRKVISETNSERLNDKQDETFNRSDLLTVDEKTQLEANAINIKSRVDILISDYDDNLSNPEKRKEIEELLANDNSEFKRIALKLAKDKIESEKLEKLNN